MPRIMILLLIWTACYAAELPEWKQDFMPEGEEWKKTAQHLRFSNGAEPETLDPQLMKGVTEHRISLAIFEGLVTNDPSDLSIRPGVAEKWDISKDGLTYTFHIRPDAKWSDGKAITSSDFITSWKRLLQKETAAEYAYQIFPVKNAEAYLKGKIKDFSKVGVSAKDPKTLIVTLHQPCPYFLDLCAFATLAPIRVDIIDKHLSGWTKPENIVSNGPFIMESWEQRKSIVLKKNPHYWDHDFVKLDKITIFPYDDAEKEYQSFLKDGLDWVHSVPQKRIDEVRRHPDYYSEPYMGTYFYRFNCTKAPFNKKLVRKALSLAINREHITKHITKAGQPPATWFCPPVGIYKHIEGLAYNPEEAKKVLADAGFPNGEGFPEIELMFNTNENHKQVAEAICQQWKDNLGITIKRRNKEWKMYLEDMTNINYDIMRSGWIGDYNDPNTFFDMFVTGGGNNRTGWSNKKYDQLLIDSQKELNPEKRMLIFQEMERILVEDEFPIIPLYITIKQGMINERVAGVEPNIRNIHPFQYIWMEE